VHPLIAVNLASITDLKSRLQIGYLLLAPCLAMAVIDSPSKKLGLDSPTSRVLGSASPTRLGCLRLFRTLAGRINPGLKVYAVCRLSHYSQVESLIRHFSPRRGCRNRPLRASLYTLANRFAYLAIGQISSQGLVSPTVVKAMIPINLKQVHSLGMEAFFASII